MSNILVNEKNVEFYTQLDAMTQYSNLRKKYTSHEVFLLESLNGPEKDCVQSVIGFLPLFSICVNENLVQIKNINSESISYSIGELFDLRTSISYQIPISNLDDFFHILKNIESIFVRNTPTSSIDGLGWFGYLGYDTIFMIEDIERKINCEKNIPVISLTVYSGVLKNNLKTGSSKLTMNIVNDVTFPSIDDILTLIKSEPEISSPPNKIDYSVMPTVRKDEYYRWFDKAKHHINIGDIYQIQFGHELHIESNLEPFQVYRRMREFNPSPYMYFFTSAEDITLIGASPEMFVSIDEHERITMRPIAGTMKKPTDLIQQKSVAMALQKDVKECAEHLMLVDLCRNDIARCCIPNTLNVDELMITENYSHVIHLVSNVTGKLIEGSDKYDVLSATFPAGTMTGTPKIRAVELIEDTEKNSRGVYAGTLGYFGFNNNYVMSALCIRTAVFQENMYFIRASGGIVEDSTAEGEWCETINKLSSAYLAITGKELINESFVG